MKGSSNNDAKTWLNNVVRTEALVLLTYILLKFLYFKKPYFPCILLCLKKGPLVPESDISCLHVLCEG